MWLLWQGRNTSGTPRWVGGGGGGGGGGEEEQKRRGRERRG